MKHYIPNHLGKFQDPRVTADGQERAHVALTDPDTLWFNTGTLCNIECLNCYIESSPTNDALTYLSVAEVRDYLNQLSQRKWPVREIGFTGGEPFMNPDILDMIEECLKRGYHVLVLTNAMRPMMRAKIRNGLSALNAAFADQLVIRVSLDHHSAKIHDSERGKGSFEFAKRGLVWLRDSNIKTAIAGRVAFAESEQEARDGFARLYAHYDLRIDAYDPAQTVLFPEMDVEVDVPEITSACWGILNKSPSDVMCSSSRMVVKRKGASAPVVLACTLIAYDDAFEMGTTLEDAEKPVSLNHPHCAKFCVLGGASCSA
jgi:organic radical activating enzyme